MSDDSPQEASPGHIVVLLDASSGSLAALRAAVLLARLLERPLDALFIQDINLLHLAGLPFCREVGSYTASVRLLDQDTIQREFRLLEQQLRGLVQSVIAAAEIEGTFRSVREGVRPAALREAASASFVGLGRVGRLRTPGRRMGSTLETLLHQATTPLLVGGNVSSELSPPLIVLFTGSEASHRALALAIDLAERRTPALSIVVAAEMVRAACCRARAASAAGRPFHPLHRRLAA